MKAGLNLLNGGLLKLISVLMILTYVNLSYAQKTSCRHLFKANPSQKVQLNWNLSDIEPSHIMWVPAKEFLERAIPYQNTVRSSHVESLMHALYFGGSHLDPKRPNGVPVIEGQTSERHDEIRLLTHHRAKAVYFLYRDGLISESELIPIKVVGTHSYPRSERHLSDLPYVRHNHPGSFHEGLRGPRPLIRHPVGRYYSNENEGPLLTPENLPQDVREKLGR